MFWQIFLFELKMRFRSRALWICWAILIFKGLTDILGAYWERAMPSHLPLNAPFSIYYLLMFASFWTQMLAVGLMAQPLLRDLSVNAAPLVFSKLVTNRGYLFGKYLASLLGLIFVASGPVVAFIILPGMVSIFGLKTPVPLMATPWAHLTHAFLLWTLTTSLAYGTMHFVLAALTGRIAPSYALAVGFFMVFMVFTVKFENLEYDKPLMQILDPLGKSTTEAQLFYWSAEERMRSFLSLSGNFLLNRLLYLSFGLGALGLAVWRFDLAKLLVKSRQRATRKRKIAPADQALAQVAPLPNSSNAVASATGMRVMRFGEQLRFAARMGWAEFARLFRLNPFRIVLLVFAVVLPISGLDVWGTKPDGLLLPSAIYVTKLIGAVVFVVSMLAMMYFVGEILGREQSARVKLLIDATPIKTGTFYAGKLLAVVLLVLLFTSFIPYSILLVQFVRGFADPHPFTVLNATLFVTLPNLLAFALLGVIFYAISNHKVMAQMVGIIAAFSVIILSEMKAVNHRLLLYGLQAESSWTDFAANDMALVRYAYGDVYWLAFAGFFLVVGYWLWARGTEDRFALRVREAGRRMKAVSVGLAVAMLAVCSFTGWQIYRNINLLNEYKTTAQELAEKAAYERKYGHLAEVAQPKITTARLQIDLYPRQYRADYQAEFQLENHTNASIAELHLETAEKVEINSLTWNQQPLELLAKDDAHRHAIYQLPVTLEPQQTATLKAVLRVAYQGFTNEGKNGTLAPDGSVFTAELLPRFGYDRAREITKPSERKIYQLPPRRLLPSVAEVATNPQELARNLAVTDDADWVDFEAAITTDADQTVAAPGKFVKAATSGDRRTFYYQSEKAGLWEFYCASARYAVTRGSWQNGDNTISIEVYHLPLHPYNAERFIASARFALHHLTQDFGAYPHRSLRIVEIPNESLEPTTSGNLILLPEQKGWLHDYRKFDANKSLDFVQYIAAREIARGWWGQTAAPAEAQGYPLLLDAMPTYAALSVLETKHGAAVTLRQIANLTDNYLRQSAIEDGREPSLLEAEQQEYVNEKGAIALYTVATRLGQKRLNAALKAYLDGLRLRAAPPFTRADEFVATLSDQTDSETQKHLLAQIFQTVTTYDYKLKQAVAQSESANHFKLRLEIEAKKFQADQTDNRAETDMREPLEVAVYLADRDEPHIVQTPAIISGNNHIEIELDRKPVRVQLDPRRLLVDRNQMDNAAPVKWQ
jgi:hypothetical protein